MQRELSNKKISISVDTEHGTITGLRFIDDADNMNWLINQDTLARYGYAENDGCLLGKSVLSIDEDYDTGAFRPSSYTVDHESATFVYDLLNVSVCNKFALLEDRFHWDIEVTNRGDKAIQIKKMYHWLPVSYIMHKNVEENCNQSCSFVPSVAGKHSHMICKKRSGKGPDLLIVNKTGEMKSTGSLCRFENLFFEKSAPSLSGLVLYNVVNAYQNKEIEEDPRIDWQYRDMYRSISLAEGESFKDSYDFYPCPAGEEKQTLKMAGVARIECPPMVFCGGKARINIDYSSAVHSWRVYAANDRGAYIESSNTRHLRLGSMPFSVGPFSKPGERKIEVCFEDHTSAFAVFAVYESTTGIVEAFCSNIYKTRFIDDPDSPDYCGYKSISRQGESCAKGALLLVKNLITPPMLEEIRQAERNCAIYLRKRWLDDDFVAVRQYPGGFARIIDLDYLILAFYLLSLFEDSQLELNSPDTYLLWAYRTSAYRLDATPDKLPREAFEVRLASITSWLEIEMIGRLTQRGFVEESRNLDRLWTNHVQIQIDKVHDKTFVETEHYFDNAGISVTAETLLNAGKIQEGIEAAQLLLANVADSNDYRNCAPDRWWEAMACMYHNLWAVLSAKAMLTAYEKTKDSRYLLYSYKSMVPMFFNYDWNAVSMRSKLNVGEGVSAYCLTSPNLNLEYASRNRFGQSVFKDGVFSQMDLDGDDWDLGTDMIVYLMTFGQKTFVTMQNGKPECVNGDIEGNLGKMRIRSFAAYPTEYYLEPFNMTILRGSNDFVIKSVTIRNGKCIQADVLPLKTNCNMEIYCLKDSIKVKINPRIRLLKSM